MVGNDDQMARESGARADPFTRIGAATGAVCRAASDGDDPDAWSACGGATRTLADARSVVPGRACSVRRLFDGAAVARALFLGVARRRRAAILRESTKICLRLLLVVNTIRDHTW